jgi:hypothetical protein
MNNYDNNRPPSRLQNVIMMLVVFALFTAVGTMSFFELTGGY